MRVEDAVTQPLLLKPKTSDVNQCRVISSEEFSERKKKKEYKAAINQLLERAKQLDW